MPQEYELEIWFVDGKKFGLREKQTGGTQGQPARARKAALLHLLMGDRVQRVTILPTHQAIYRGSNPNDRDVIYFERTEHATVEAPGLLMNERPVVGRLGTVDSLRAGGLLSPPYSEPVHAVDLHLVGETVIRNAVPPGASDEELMELTVGAAMGAGGNCRAVLMALGGEEERALVSFRGTLPVDQRDDQFVAVQVGGLWIDLGPSTSVERRIRRGEFTRPMAEPPPLRPTRQDSWGVP